MPFFSTIIPTHNRQELIGETLASVLSQEFDDQEIIVVDNGSTDDTVGVVRRHGDRIRILTEPQKGPAFARNRGIAAATGEYVCFLDSDDVWFPWTLATYRRVIEEFGRPAFVTGVERKFRVITELKDAAESDLQVEPHADYFASSRCRYWIQPGSVAIRRDVVDRVGGFASHGHNFEESDLWFRLGTAPGFVRITSPPVVGYRLHPESLVSNVPASIAGTWHILEAARRGDYGLDSARQGDRTRLIAAHVRAFVFNLVKWGYITEAWKLYRSTFGMQLAQGRARYLAGVPAMMGARALQGARGVRPSGAETLNGGPR